MEMIWLRALQSLGGIVVCCSTYIIISTAKKQLNIPFFILILTYSDFLTGFALVLFGLSDVVDIGDNVEKSSKENWKSCCYGFVDNLHVLIIISFAISRLYSAVYPSCKTNIVKKINVFSIFFPIALACLCFTVLMRAYFGKLLSLIHDHYSEDSKSMKIMQMWVIETKYFAGLIAFFLSCLTWVLLVIRLSRPTWSQKILKNGNNHLSISIISLGRSLFFLSSEAISLEFFMSDYIFRLTMSRIFCVATSTLLSFICLLSFFHPFLENLTVSVTEKKDLPRIEVSGDKPTNVATVNSSCSQIWSTDGYCIAQMNFEHHTTRAERERSISFYREVRGENDILFQKLKEAQELRRLEKEKRKIKREQNSNLLAVPQK